MKPLKPISDKEFSREIIRHFLGEDWCVVDPLSHSQVLAIALDEIKKNYKPKRKKIC